MGEHTKRPPRGMVAAALLLALVALGLLRDAKGVADGVRTALGACGGVLIPSLFPFMALCCYLSRTDYSRVLSVPLAPLTTRVFKLPREHGVIVLLSLIGGYPVGAKMISNLLEQGHIDARTASRMLCFCVNASPSFLISAVGVGMLGNRRVGVLLYASQVIATIFVGAAVSLRAPRPARSAGGGWHRGGVGAFVGAVSDASSAMIGMCAYALLFAAVLALITGTGAVTALAAAVGCNPEVAQSLLNGLFEVTLGSIQAAKTENAVVLLTLCASFGGLSVLFQAISFFKGLKVRFAPMFACRVAHCVLAVAAAKVLFHFFAGDVRVWAPSTPVAQTGDARTVILSVCLLCMGAILVAGTWCREE